MKIEWFDIQAVDDRWVEKVVVSDLIDSKVEETVDEMCNFYESELDGDDYEGYWLDNVEYIHKDNKLIICFVLGKDLEEIDNEK